MQLKLITVVCVACLCVGIGRADKDELQRRDDAEDDGNSSDDSSSGSSAPPPTMPSMYAPFPNLPTMSPFHRVMGHPPPMPPMMHGPHPHFAPMFRPFFRPSPPPHMIHPHPSPFPFHPNMISMAPPIKHWDDHLLDQVLMSESHIDPIGLLGEPIVIDEADLYGPPRRRASRRYSNRPRPLIRPTRLPGYEAPRPSPPMERVDRLDRLERDERVEQSQRRDNNNYEPTPMEDRQMEERYDRYRDYDDERPLFFPRRPMFESRRDLFDYEDKKKK